MSLVFDAHHENIFRCFPNCLKPIKILRNPIQKYVLFAHCENQVPYRSSKSALERMFPLQYFWRSHFFHLELLRNFPSLTQLHSRNTSKWYSHKNDVFKLRLCKKNVDINTATCNTLAIPHALDTAYSKNRIDLLCYRIRVATCINLRDMFTECCFFE